MSVPMVVRSALLTPRSPHNQRWFHLTWLSVKERLWCRWRTVAWRVESRFDNGIAVLNNTLFLSSTAALGNIRFINYLDEDVAVQPTISCLRRETPGQADFRVYTIDGPERFGFFSRVVFTLPEQVCRMRPSPDGRLTDSRRCKTTLQVQERSIRVNGTINLATLPALVDRSWEMQTVQMMLRRLLPGTSIRQQHRLSLPVFLS